jgi:drug/metabolite transporter (DMT)-like permease
MLLFGVATYVIAWASQRAGALPSLWFARTSSAALFVIAALVIRARSRAGSERGPVRTGLGLAAVVGLVDLLGTLSYVYGAEVGLVSVVTAVSATYPLLPVFGGVVLLHERPAPNQYLGVAMVVGGLVLLGVA